MTTGAESRGADSAASSAGVVAVSATTGALASVSGCEGKNRRMISIKWTRERGKRWMICEEDETCLDVLGGFRRLGFLSGDDKGVD